MTNPVCWNTEQRVSVDPSAIDWHHSVEDNSSENSFISQFVCGDKSDLESDVAKIFPTRLVSMMNPITETLMGLSFGASALQCFLQNPKVPAFGVICAVGAVTALALAGRDAYQMYQQAT